VTFGEGSSTWPPCMLFVSAEHAEMVCGHSILLSAPELGAVNSDPQSRQPDHPVPTLPTRSVASDTMTAETETEADQLAFRRSDQSMLSPPLTYASCNLLQAHTTGDRWPLRLDLCPPSGTGSLSSRQTLCCVESFNIVHVWFVHAARNSALRYLLLFRLNCGGALLQPFAPSLLSDIVRATCNLLTREPRELAVHSCRYRPVQ